MRNGPALLLFFPCLKILKFSFQVNHLWVICNSLQRHTHIHRRLHEDTPLHVRTLVDIQSCMFICVYSHVSLHGSIDKCIHICLYTYIHIDIHVYIKYVLWQMGMLFFCLVAFISHFFTFLHGVYSRVEQRYCLSKYRSVGTIFELNGALLSGLVSQRRSEESRSASV